MGKLLSSRYVILCCFLACFSSSFFANGQSTIDSLIRNLQSADDDSQKLIAYNRIFLHYEYSNPDSDIYYLRQGLSLFTAHKYSRGMAEMLSGLAGLYSTQGMPDIAKQADDQALSIYTELNDKRGIANAHDIRGVIEGRKGNYSEATNHFFIALKIFEEINDANAITDTYIKLGAASEFSNDHDKALEYYKLGLSLLKGKHDTDIATFLDNNIGNVYVSKKDFPEAMKYLQKALKESEGPDYAQIHILPLENLGDLYSKMGDTDRALDYCQQALAIAEKEHLREDRARILITIAELKRSSDPAKSVSILDEAMQIATTIGDRKTQTDVLGSLISIYKDQGNYIKAYYLLEQQKDLSDSMLNIDKARAVANVEALYDLDKLNSRMQRAQQSKTAIFAVAVLLTVFLFILVFLLWKTSLLNRELYERELKLEKASTVKNKLISIIAHDLIGSIRFMPLALGLCRDESIPAEEKNSLLSQVELNAVASSETLQNMLDWGKAQIQGIVLKQSVFNVKEISEEVLQFVKIAANNKLIAVKEDIAPDIVVYADENHFKFIFRNLLSNAIKYTNKGGGIEITAEKSADSSHIIFSVKDNGVGISDDIVPVIFEPFGTSIIGTDNENGNGIGLNLCKEFVVQNGGEIWVESEKDKGSIFRFSLKAFK